MKDKFVLVSFGKDILISDLVKLIGTDKERFAIEAGAIKNKVPHYKSETSATQEEKVAFMQYATFLQEKLSKGEI